MSLLLEPADPKLLHLVSTPIAIMAQHGLRTYAGVTGDDPSNARNKGASYTVILSIYGKSALLGRIIAGTVGANEHYFVDIDAEVARFGWSETASLCIVHRIPAQYVSGNTLVATAITHNHTDFAMYRTVVQYGVTDKGMGSVIYETPPNLNMTGKKPHFLSFSNKVYLHPDTDSYFSFLNYSVSPDYTQAADVKIEFHDASGATVGRHAITVPPFDFSCIRVADIVGDLPPSTFLSFTAASISSALIPLSIVVNRKCGGVSVEHSHPPQEYVMADWSVVNNIKFPAAKSLFGN